jgi:hypothetical protein
MRAQHSFAKQVTRVLNRWTVDQRLCAPFWLLLMAPCLLIGTAAVICAPAAAQTPAAGISA